MATVSCRIGGVDLGEAGAIPQVMHKGGEKEALAFAFYTRHRDSRKLSMVPSKPHGDRGTAG